MKNKLSTLIFAALMGYIPFASAFNIFDVLIHASKAEKVYIYGSGPIEDIAKALFTSDASDEDVKKGGETWEQKRERESAEMDRTFDDLVKLLPEDQREQARITLRERFSDLVFDHPSVYDRLTILRREAAQKSASLN